MCGAAYLEATLGDDVDRSSHADKGVHGRANRIMEETVLRDGDYVYRQADAGL